MYIAVGYTRDDDNNNMFNVCAGSLITRDPFSGRRAAALQTMTYYYSYNHYNTRVHIIIYLSHRYSAYTCIGILNNNISLCLCQQTSQ